MIIFGNRWKRLFRSRLTLLLVLGFPPLMISFLFGLGSSSAEPITLGLVDQDRTELTYQLEEVMKGQALVIHLEEKEMTAALADNRIDVALVVENGFTEDLLKRRNLPIYSISIQNSHRSIPLGMTAENLIRAAEHLAQKSEGDETLFYRSLGKYRQGPLRLEVIHASGADPMRSNFAVGSMGILGLNMLFLGIHTAMHILKDRENKTFYRVMISPMPQWSYMLQSILCFFLILLVQITGVFLISHYGLEMYLGANTKAVFAVMTVFAMVCVAFGIAVVALTKTTKQAATTASLLLTPMAMLGGMLWPREIMPEILQRVGWFLPTTWMMEAVGKVVDNGALLDAAWEVAILLLFALVFFLLGSWRRTDMMA